MRSPVAQDSVVFGYGDQSGIWIEGQRMSAVRHGLARDPYEAMRSGIFDSAWRCDYSALYRLAFPCDANVGRSILFGSARGMRAPWRECAHDTGWEVEIFDRAGRAEKRVDVAMAVCMVSDASMFMHSTRHVEVVVLAGDQDFCPAVDELHKRGIRVKIMFWSHGTSRSMRELADEYVELDPYFEELTLKERCRP
jgi:uncharacterized LabA/DUF88 family protein